MFVMCVLEGEDQVRGRNVVVHAGWTVDISKDSSVVEHLTSGAGFNSQSSHIFFICVSICCSFFPSLLPIQITRVLYYAAYIYKVTTHILAHRGWKIPFLNELIHITIFIRSSKK